MGTKNTDIAAFLANGGTITRVAEGTSGKGSKPPKRASASKATSKVPAIDIDTSVDGWQWEALNHPAIKKAIKSGVFTALVGSGWGTDKETVDERISHAKVELARKYLADYDPSKAGLYGYVRHVAFQRTLNYIALHVHRYDGAVGAMKIDPTDATAEDKTPRVITDESSMVGFLRVEQREELEQALSALSEAERAHFRALMAGQTSAEWAKGAGLSPVQATRQKTAMVAKLAKLLGDE